VGRHSAIPSFPLTRYERAALLAWSGDANGPDALRTRARIVLACAEGRSNMDIAAMLGCHRSTVATWRRRFVEHRLAALRGVSLASAADRLSDDQVAELIATTIDTLPPTAHWSRGTMARRFGVSQSAVARVWQAHGLAPHLDSGSEVAMTNDRLIDVVGLYLRPPQRAIALALAAPAEPWAIDWASPLTRRSPAGRADPRNMAAILRGITQITRAQGPNGHRSRPGDGVAFRRFLSLMDGAAPPEALIRVVSAGVDHPGEPRSARVRVESVSASRWAAHVGRWLLQASQRPSRGSPDALTLQIDVWARDPGPGRDALIWVNLA
jgi:transposase